MWPLAVVVLHIFFAEQLQEMSLVRHDHMVEALPAKRPPMTRSATALAFGACTGVTIVVMRMRAAR
jgi:hypothetical protein